MATIDLKGKGAIVTGAASGIGRGIARALAQAGANVVLADVQEDALNNARNEIAALGAQAFALRLDVSDGDAVRAAAAQAEKLLGKVHLVFNNAGVELSGVPLEGYEGREWDWIIGVNVYGVLHGIRHFVPLIRKHGEGGHVVNTASVAGFWVNPDIRFGPYSMTKYAVVALSEALEQDLKDSGIGASVLCPGPVRSRLFESTVNRPLRFGGAYRRAGSERLRDSLAGGMEPDEVGARVLRGIREREFYIFTHKQTKEWLAVRFRRILDAFDRVA